MRFQAMGSQGGDSNDEKQSQFEELARQNSMYSLTLDEVQTQLGDLGKPLSSMNLDELLKTVWTAEATQSVGPDFEATALANQSALQHQASLSLTGALSKKTVDEVWRDIQQDNNNEESKSQERQPTLGEMTLEDFLVKAGVVAESSSDKKGTSPVIGDDSNIAQQFPQHGQWMQFPQPQYQHPQQSMMGAYMPAQSIMDVTYPENQAAVLSPLMGTSSDTQTPLTGSSDRITERTVERRRKRMIKNRESAARSRARKQAYTNELENKVSRLEEENERLRKWKELEQMLPSSPPPEPKYNLLRRTTSALF